MGLNKYAGKFEDISNWTTEKIIAKSHEILKSQKEVFEDCIRSYASFDEQLRILQDELSKRNGGNQ